MKSQLYFFSIFFVSLILISKPLHANHAAGGSIQYTHLQGNQYAIHAELYRDCVGDLVPATLTVYISSVSCGVTDSLVLDPVPGQFGQEVTLPCPGQPTTCQGGLKPGIQRWEYEKTYAFPGQCSDWKIFTTIAHRNAAITTIQNPASTTLYIEATLNNSVGDNSSVDHAVDVLTFICIGQAFTYNLGAVDAEGDSLVFELIPARIDANTNVTYLGSYTAQDPISGSQSAIFNSSTGDLSLFPTSIETGLMVIRVLEYRNSVLMGSTMYEGEIYTTPCANHPPVCFDQLGLYNFSVLPGPFCFNILSSDPDTMDTLSIYYNGGIPAATFFTTNGAYPVGTFCWDPDSSDVRPQPYSFTITVEDNSCPMQGAQVYAWTITVTLDTSLVTHFPVETSFSGNVFYDANQNKIRDGNEFNLVGQRIDISPDNASVFTDINGNYDFKSFLVGPQTLSIVPFPNWHLTTDSASFTFADDSLLHSGLDFGLAPDTPSFNALEIHFGSGTPTCQSIEYYYLSYTNSGSNIADGRIILVLDSDVYFNGSNPSPDLISGDTLIYNFNNLSTFEPGEIHIGLLLPQAGTQLNYIYSIELDSAGNYVELDNGSLQQTVGCSYDPNDKAVSPEGLYSDHRVLSTDPLQYTIRFQNTGNDTAFTVFVHDMIDPSLDIQTLHVVGSSHTMTTTIFPDRMVEFRFNNIHLPDSNIDEPGSNGFIQYEIMPLQNISLPVVVKNEASIFFDSNSPVPTNTVWNTLVSDLTVGISPIQTGDEMILVKPNPFHHNAEIVFGKSFMNVESQFSIMDVMGRILESRKVYASSIFISGENLQRGIYFVQLISSDGQKATTKFIIE